MKIRAFGVIRMQASLLILSLAEPLERYQAEFKFLWSKLPEGSQKIYDMNSNTGTFVAILVPQMGEPDDVQEYLSSALSAFENWEILGLTGETLSKYPKASVLSDWMAGNPYIRPTRTRAVVVERKRHKPKNMPPTQGR
jgi:hypothetical protein